ncbi:MAG: hypothetical protein GOVbin630_168 [Prokaryotic dsDNA virus sp.]|nr:MAG: hypothetical protein GOVbin630_168 [Prokaryotic dsDNA virus sp.]
MIKKGELVRIIAPPDICLDLAGEVGIVMEYLSLDESVALPDPASYWFPTQPIVVVLIKSEIAFFYEDEIEIITKE